ncbi:MAG: hypothetical protein ACK5MT_11250 [Actinomycetales bacterium]
MASSPAPSTSDSWLLVLRICAIAAAALALVQGVLGSMLVTGNLGTLDVHSIIGMSLSVVCLVAAIAAVVRSRRGGNKGLVGHSVGMFALTIVQIGLGEARVETLHVLFGVIFLIGAIGLATLAMRRPNQAVTAGA